MKIRIGSTTYEVPTNYSQVKFKDFAHLKTEGLTLEKKISYQTTIPVEILTNLPLSEISKLIEATAFFESEPEMYEAFESEIEVGNEAYIKIEQSRAQLRENPWLGVIEVVKTYTGKDISELTVTEVYGIAAFFLTRCQGSLSGGRDLESTSRTKTN